MPQMIFTFIPRVYSDAPNRTQMEGENNGKGSDTAMEEEGTSSSKR